MKYNTGKTSIRLRAGIKKESKFFGGKKGFTEYSPSDPNTKKSRDRGTSSEKMEASENQQTIRDSHEGWVTASSLSLPLY